MNKVRISGSEFPNPVQFEDIGIKSKLMLQCHQIISSLEFGERLAECIVEDRPNGGKTYVIVFEGGGTCEFDISEHGYLDLMDSHGVDFAWAGNGEIQLSPHRPSTAPGSRSFWGRQDEKADEGGDESNDTADVSLP